MKLEFVTPTQVEYHGETFILADIEGDYVTMMSTMDSGQILMPKVSGEWAKMRIVREGGESCELCLPARPE